MRDAVRSAFWAAAVVALALAFYWNARLGAADWRERRGTVDDLNAALRLAPGDAQYWLQLAQLDSGDDRTGLADIRRAAEISPFYSDAWMTLALREEPDDPAAAERDLLGAAAVDKGFKPRWNLASFYFRHGNEREFWKWTRETLVIASDYQDALFRLCWQMRPDADAILKSAIPERLPALVAYLDYLRANGKLEAADKVAQKILPIAGSDEQPALIRYCDNRMATGQRVEDAVRVWNAMCKRGLVFGDPVYPETTRFLGNGGFLHMPLEAGFDWRINKIDGVLQRWIADPVEFKLEFSGKQPEYCEPLIQLVLLEPGRRYTLSYTYRLDGIQPGSGLKWELVNFVPAAPIVPDAASFSSLGQARAEANFSVPPEFRFGRLALVYQRVLGTTRAEGSVTVSDVSLQIAR